jgi:hypothetical protein
MQSVPQMVNIVEIYIMKKSYKIGLANVLWEYSIVIRSVKQGVVVKLIHCSLIWQLKSFTSAATKISE